MTASEVSLFSLRQILVQRFDEGEIRDLCFDLAVDYGNLPGESKLGKVRELIAYLDRRNEIPRLLAAGRAARPDIDWDLPRETAPDRATDVDMPPATTTAGSGDTFTMSGDFRGAVVNIKSTLTHVQQQVGAIQSDDQAPKAELERLVGGLNAVLQNLPADTAEQADAVAGLAVSLIEAATGDRPNKTMVRIAGEGLQEAAGDLAAVAPDLPSLATQIVAVVTRMIGLAQ